MILFLFLFQWRRFTFFDLHRQVDNGKIAECLQVCISNIIIFFN